MKNKRILFISISIILIIILIISIIVFMINNRKTHTENKDIDEQINIIKLEENFNYLFINEENEYVSTLYNLAKEENGRYKIQAKIPYVHINKQIDDIINEEINNIFTAKLLQIYNENETYSTIAINYVTRVSNNILSLMIKCELKEGASAKRVIIKTFNYDLEKQQLIKLIDIIPKEKNEIIQSQIIAKIDNEKKKEETILRQGYKMYTRDINSDIYLLDNASDFFVDSRVVYIIYSYGNNSYTSEIDLIIIQI